MEDRGQYMCQVNTDPMKMQVSQIVIQNYFTVFLFNFYTYMSYTINFFFTKFEIQTAFLEVVIPPDIIYEETSGDMMVIILTFGFWAFSIFLSM